MTKATTLILATLLLAGCQPATYSPQVLREALQVCDVHQGVTEITLNGYRGVTVVKARCTDGVRISKQIKG